MNIILLSSLTPCKVIFASGKHISLDSTDKRFLEFSVSNEVSLKVRRIRNIRETLDFSVHLHWKWENLVISSLLGLVLHKLEIRLPEAKIVLKGRWCFLVSL